MPEITVSNLGNKTITTNDQSATVLKVAQENFLDWMHACGGKGRCTTCKFVIIAGEDQLGPLSNFEKKMHKADLLKKNERLACQCKALGDIIVKIPSDSKLPHLQYDDD